MTRDEALKILEEVKEHQKIATYIDAHYVLSYDPKDKLRRGTIMTETAEALDIIKNRHFWDKFQKIVRNKGFKFVTVNGIKMYKYAKRKV